jgi:quinol monooxygenase YgiN
MAGERNVLVRAELHGLAGDAALLRDVVREHAEQLARADGCLSAAATAPLDGDAGELRLDVLWRDESALRAHYGTPQYARYVQRVSELLARPSDVTVHVIAHSYRATAELDADPTRLG